MSTDPRLWLEWLVGTDEERAHEARLALGGLRPGDDVDVQPLLGAVAAGDDRLVLWSLVALGRLEAKAGAALGAIARVAAEAPGSGTRQAAVHALSKIAPGDDVARAALRRALADESPLVRREALQAFIAVPGVTEAELREISALERDADPTVRRWSEISLRNIRASLAGR